jgi:preprotein translocase subunit SecE
MSEDKQGFLKGAVKFIPEVREEVGKVTWPSRRETTMTTLFVFVFALIAAIYFMVVDTIIHKTINAIVGYLTH